MYEAHVNIKSKNMTIINTLLTAFQGFIDNYKGDTENKDLLGKSMKPVYKSMMVSAGKASENLKKAILEDRIQTTTDYDTGDEKYVMKIIVKSDDKDDANALVDEAKNTAEGDKKQNKIMKQVRKLLEFEVRTFYE